MARAHAGYIEQNIIRIESPNSAKEKYEKSIDRIWTKGIGYLHFRNGDGY